MAEREPTAEGQKTGAGTGYAVSPINGARMPTGAHPGNTGGKKGRSGRRPDRVRQLAMMGVEEGVYHLRTFVSGQAIEEHIEKRRGEDGETTWHWSPASIDQRLAAIDRLHKIANEGTIALDVYRRQVQALVNIVSEELASEPEARNRILGRMQEVFR